MELAEVKKKIEELKGRFDAPFGSSDKSTIEYLYYEVTGKTFVPTSCQQCYHDGLIEIYHYIKKYGKMAEKSNYRLRAGAIINCPTFMGGKVFTNDNLTDEVAKNYLSSSQIMKTCSRRFQNTIRMLEAGKSLITTQMLETARSNDTKEERK